MKPFEISLEYLVKSRLNQKLLERMVAAMGGISDEEKAQMLAHHELTDWNRAAAKGGLGSVGVTQPNPKGRDWVSEEHIESMFPSLRHKKNKPDYWKEGLSEEARLKDHEIKMRNLEAKQLEGMRLETDSWGNEDWKDRPTLEQELAEKVHRFKESDMGRKMLENLKERQRNRKIEQITGVPAPPMPPISDVIHEHLDEHYPIGPSLGYNKIVREENLTGAATGMTEEDRALLHHLKGGGIEPLEFLQAHGQGETPLIGDMPLQTFEQIYPTEMAPPQGATPQEATPQGAKTPSPTTWPEGCSICGTTETNVWYNDIRRGLNHVCGECSKRVDASGKAHPGPCSKCGEISDEMKSWGGECPSCSGEVQSAPSIAAASVAPNWECNVCSFVNNADKKTCVICNNARPLGNAQVTLDNLFAPEGSAYWEEQQ